MTLLFLAGLAGAFLLSGCLVKTTTGTYSHADRYKVGNFEYQSSGIREVEINWIAGSVTLEPSDAKTLSVSEDDKNLKDDQKLHWYLDGDILRIQYCKSAYSGNFPKDSKHLVAQIPEGIDLSIHVVSADVNLDADASFGKITYGTVSGNLMIPNLTASELDFDTVSGNLYADSLTASLFDSDSVSGVISVAKADVARVDMDTVSGDITIGLSSCERFTADSVSGDITILSLPDEGATVTFRHGSGTLHADGYTVSGDSMIFGRGGCRIDAGTTSGDLYINAEK